MHDDGDEDEDDHWPTRPPHATVTPQAIPKPLCQHACAVLPYFTAHSPPLDQSAGVARSAIEGAGRLWSGPFPLSATSNGRRALT